MNRLYLLSLRLKQYAAKSRLIFALFVIGGVMNTVAVLYCYGNLLPTVASRNSQDLQYRNYQVVFKQAVSLNRVEQLLEDPLIAACAFSGQDAVYACLGEYSRTFSSGTGTFTGEYQITAPAAYGQSVGDVVRYQGRDFTVIGIISSEGPEHVIPYETYLELNGTDNILRIHVLAAQRQSLENDLVVKLLQETFPQAEYIGGPTVVINQGEVRTSQIRFVMIAVNALLSVVAYTLLLHYLLSTMRRENVILLVLGISKMELGLFLFREAFLLSASVVGVGIVFHNLFYNQIFVPLNLYPHITYRGADYGVIALLLLSISLVTVIPVTLRETLVTPDGAKRKVL